MTSELYDEHVWAWLYYELHDERARARRNHVCDLQEQALSDAFRRGASMAPDATPEDLLTAALQSILAITKARH